MAITEILSPGRVSIASAVEGVVRSKEDALTRLSALLANGQSKATPAEIDHVLSEREKLQSTGVGGGVAIPHGALDKFDHMVGAVLLCPEPIDFGAIDGAPVSILFAVIGPKRSTGEHLKTLARVSRLLRDEGFRERLLKTRAGTDAFALIAAEEGRGAAP